ncbi:MAG: hypothetical protein MHM6MM_000864 [Cercozoa sp. M6MM]
MSRENCRFYKNKFPEVGEVVFVEVKRITEVGAYVELLEYNGVEGMILMSQLSKRRIRSVQSLIRVGKKDVASVMRVDEQRGDIDLSKKDIEGDAAAIEAAKDRYTKATHVHSTLARVAELLNEKHGNKDATKLALYEAFGWQMYSKYGHAFAALRRMAVEPEVVVGEFNIDPEVAEILVSEVQKRECFKVKTYKLRTTIDVTCVDYEGVDAIKRALMVGRDLFKNADGGYESKDDEVDIKLIAPPRFIVTLQSMDKRAGIEKLQQVIDAIQTDIEKSNGNVSVFARPRAVGDDDDERVRQMMEAAYAENQPAGDEDED